MFGDASKTLHAVCRVNNVPTYAEDSPYWVVRAVSGALWFYGAWDDEDRANEVANEVSGFVVYNDGNM